MWQLTSEEKTKKMKFRFHKGGLDDSLKTTIEVNSLLELSSKLGNPSKIDFEHILFDHRTNWDTYYVIADDKIVGMSDGEIK